MQHQRYYPTLLLMLALMLVAVLPQSVQAQKALRADGASVSCSDATITFDSGVVGCITPAKNGNGILAPQAGSLTTLFAANNSFAGNTFDIEVTKPVRITGFDVNLDDAGATSTVDVYYRMGTAVGVENDPSAWTLLGSDAGVVNAGIDLPSYVDVGGLVLSPGQVYGFYVDLSSWLTSLTSMLYTNGGPTAFSNADMTLTTNTGQAAPAFSGSFFPRQWNGTVYYEDVNADLYVHKYQTIDEEYNEVEYHVVVENLGPGDATGVEALDDLPAGLVVTNWSTSQGTFDPFTGIWTVGDVANGGTAELWIYGTFDAEGRYTNSVSVSGDLDDPDLDNNYAEVSFVVTGDRIVPDFVPGGAAGGIVDRGNRFTADLMLTKVADNTTPAVGDDVVWTITVTNQGPQSTAKVEVTDTPDSCLAPVGATASQGSFDTSTFIWDVGKIKVGDSATLEVITTITADCTGEVANTAEVTASSLPDPDDQFNLFDDPPVEDEIDTEIVTVTPNSRAVTLDGTTFALGTNYPNPFNPTTMIPFSVAEASFVSIKVYDLLGRTVSTLVDGTLSAGVHEVQFEASQLPTGMYIVRMEAGGIVKTQRVTLMK